MITISPGNIWTLVEYDRQGASPLKNVLSSNLEIAVPEAEYVWAYKSGEWDGRVKLWQDITSNGKHTGVEVRTGLVPRLIEALNKGGVTWQPGTDRRNLPSNTILQYPQVKLRKYQTDAVNAAFQNTQEGFGWWARGVLEMSAGSGKTETAVAMYEMNPVPTFFLVHRKDLLIQAKERFEKYGHDVGVIGNGQFDINPNLNIATLQTLKRIFDDPTSVRAGVMAALLVDCQQVFVDEVHLMASSLDKGNEFISVVDKFDVPFSWGLTATPFMRSQYDNLLLEAVTGSSLYCISTKELVKLGYLTPPKVIMKHVLGKLEVSVDWKRGRSSKAKSALWRKVETLGIKFNEVRTNIILDEMAKGPFPLLVLVKTVEQAEFIQKLYTLRGFPKPLFLSGKDSAKVRRAAVEGLIDGSIDILIVTTIFDEGVNIPQLRKVILASGGKSQVKTIQRVGRVLRKVDGKKEAIIVDFQDGHHPMLKRHAAARKKVYVEQGYKITSE